jgi:chromosome segregation ATPase
MIDENASENFDYKEVSERLRRRLHYRETQLSALRQSLKINDTEAPSLLNESFISNFAQSDTYPRVVEEIRRSANDAQVQELAEMRLKLKQTSEQLSFQTRRANLLNERLSELENRGVVASGHSRASDAELARQRSRVAELEGERQSLLSQTAGLEQTRIILKKQIEKINDLKNKVRTSSTQTDGSLRLSTDELELRVLRGELENKNSQMYTLTIGVKNLQDDLLAAETRASGREQELKREVAEVRENYEVKITLMKRDATKAYTDLAHSHQEELDRIRHERDDKAKSIVAEYERKLEGAIIAREQTIKASAESALAGKCRNLEVALFQISEHHELEIQAVNSARIEYEKEVRREMEIFEAQMAKERDSSRDKVDKAEKKVSELLDLSRRLDEELKKTMSSRDELEVAKDASVQELENFCAEKDARINTLTLELERAKDVAVHSERKLELLNSERDELFQLETEKSQREISALTELIETEKRKLADVKAIGDKAITDLKHKVASLQSEISQRELALQSEESRAHCALVVKDMEVSSLKVSVQRFQERVADLQAELEREQIAAEHAQKRQRESECRIQEFETLTWELEVEVAALDSKSAALEAEMTQVKDLEAARQTQIADLHLSTREETNKLQDKLVICQSEIGGLESERQELSLALHEKTRELLRLREQTEILEIRQSEIFSKNLVESATSPESFALVTRQLKLETTALIDHLASGRDNSSVVEELRAEMARLYDSREVLSVSARDLCNKVEVMTAKYRRTQHDLQNARDEARHWQLRFVNHN